MHGVTPEMTITFTKLRNAVKLDSWHDWKNVSYVRSNKPGRRQTDMRLQEITPEPCTAQSLYRQKGLSRRTTPVPAAKWACRWGSHENVGSENHYRSIFVPRHTDSLAACNAEICVSSHSFRWCLDKASLDCPESAESSPKYPHCSIKIHFNIILSFPHAL